MPFLVGLVVLLAGAMPAVAQHTQHHPQQETAQQADSSNGMMPGGMMENGMMQDGMMQDGMMQEGMMRMMHEHMGMMEQMMRNPLHRSAMLVHMLPTMQEPLALSGDQVARLEQHETQFGTQKQAHQKQLMQARQRLQAALASEDAAPDRVRSLLEEVAVHQAQMQALAYETASQMKRGLSAEQRTKLSEMKPMQMHHHMMMNMTMMDMMQAMHGDMMGMMPGAMMSGMQDGMGRRTTNP